MLHISDVPSHINGFSLLINAVSPHEDCYLANINGISPLVIGVLPYRNEISALRNGLLVLEDCYLANINGISLHRYGISLLES